MKSFLAASNGLYIQTISLPAGKYTFSAIVKSPNQMWAFAIEETGGWRTFEINLHTVQYRKVSVPFITAGVTKINIISGHASPTNIIELAAPMLNGGTMASQAKKHELDLDEASSEAEAKIIALENKTGAFAEPSINPAENTLLAGSMLVGNSSGTNAGLSGTGSLPTSVRLWAGGTFADRATANWVMRDDGVEERWMTYNSVRVIIERRGYFNNMYSHTIYNPADGSIAKRTTVQNGFTTEEWYKDGVLQYEIGRNGIYYVSEIAESYTLKRLVNLSSNTATSDLTIFHNTIRAHMWQKTSNPNQFELRGNKDAYLYSAGRNVYSESNKQYEGYKNTQTLNDNITDGWYAFEQLGMMMEDGVDQTKKIVNLIRVQGGKAVQSGTTAVETTGYVFNQF